MNIIYVNLILTVTPENDPFVKLADEAMQWLSKAAIPGAYWVDFMPIRKKNSAS